MQINNKKIHFTLHFFLKLQTNISNLNNIINNIHVIDLLKINDYLN